MMNHKAAVSVPLSTVTVVVRNLAGAITEDIVDALLSPHHIQHESCRLVREPDEAGTCVAYIVFACDALARTAVRVLHKTTVLGRILEARLAPAPFPLEGTRPSPLDSCQAIPQASPIPRNTQASQSSLTIKISGLSPNVTEHMLLCHFQTEDISSCRIVRRVQKPYAYINFKHPSGAEKALAVDKTFLDGQEISVKRKELHVDMGTTIKVTQLPAGVQECDIEEEFNKFGTILEIRLNPTQPPHAFVTYCHEEEAESAALHLNKTLFMKTSTIKVKVVQPTGVAVKVTQLPSDTKESEIWDVFGSFGTILEVKLRPTSPPHAFITYGAYTEATKAVRLQQFRGVRVKVSMAQIKSSQRPYPASSTTQPEVGSSDSSICSPSKALASPLAVNSSDNGNTALLREDDLIDVMEEVINLDNKWKVLGQALRLKSADLDDLSSRHAGHSTECLRGVLLAWLQQRYDVRKYGLPCWEMLCKAVEGRAGANDPSLAKKIAQRHGV